MGIVIHENHVICIPETDLSGVNEHVYKPKADLPELPFAVLSQVTSVAKRISALVLDFSGDEILSDKASLIAEAIINAVSHGNQADVTKQARVRIFALLENGTLSLQIDIADEGTQLFSVDAEIDEALDPDNLDRPNGRGMLMMSRVAKFDILGPELLDDGKGKHLTFTKKFPLHPDHLLAASKSSQA